MLGPTTWAVEKRGSSTVKRPASRITSMHRSRRVTNQPSSTGTHETGSRSRTLPIPGLAEHGIGFKTVAEAIHLRNRLLSSLDAAESHDEEARRALLTFVFVGGGYAGVEALAELEDLARGALKLYPMLHTDDLRWVLVEEWVDAALLTPP